MGAACAPGTPDPPRKSKVCDKNTLRFTSRKVWSWRAHTMLAPRLVSAPRASPSQRTARAAFAAPQSWCRGALQCFVRVHPGQGTIARVPRRPANPGTRQQQFPKPFSEARTGQVSRATGRGRSFSKGPTSLSLQPMRNRRFPVHCCLLLTPQRSAIGLAVYEQGALPVPSPIHLSAPFTKFQPLWITWLGARREKKKKKKTTKTQVPKTTEVYIRRYLPYAPSVTNDNR